MANERMSLIENTIREKAKRDATTAFTNLWQGITYLHGKPGSGLIVNALSSDERKTLDGFKNRMLDAYVAGEQERAIAHFVATYNQLILQFPDLVEQVREETIQEMGQ